MNTKNVIVKSLSGTGKQTVANILRHGKAGWARNRRTGWYRMYAWIVGLTLVGLSACSSGTYDLGDYGLKPDQPVNASPLMARALAQIADDGAKGPIVVKLPAGRYDFYPEEAVDRVYYISNHDQDNPKRVGIALENMQDVTFDGQGSELVFHGRMLPVSLVNSENCTLKNFSIDFETPHITQATVVANDTVAGIIDYELAPWVRYRIQDSTLISQGEGWENTPGYCIAFEPDTRRLVYRSSDVWVKTKGIAEIAPRRIRATGWRNPQLPAGTVLAMRTWERPAPGIFLSYDTNTVLENIQVHYAEGMGLLAQMSEDITLDGFSVCLRGADDSRYFTTQADATHFSGCKGRIVSKNGLYEGMMDDAINIHGTYLKVRERLDDRTLIGEYMHPQAYGFKWGEAGDSVQFIASRTMELTGRANRIASIEAVDKPVDQGVKQFRIVFEQPLDPAIGGSASSGIENLTWTPEVVFEHNVIRNNRARGSLFSTPRKTLVQENEFDHTSGTAILLCGDCNGWYETGACREVLIRRNRFENALTNMFQFTNAVISIYPEIPDLAGQKAYFHSGIVIEENSFDTFDQPILYAKSVDGLVFRNNVIRQNIDYPAFHWNNHRFLFERVTGYTLDGNTFDTGFDEKKDVKIVDVSDASTR